MVKEKDGDLALAQGVENLGKLLLGLETDDGCPSLVQEREEMGRLLLELEREEFGRQSLVLEREDCCLSLVLEVEEMGRLSMVLVKEDILSLVHEKVDKENRGMTGKDMEDIGTDIDYFWRA